MKTSASQNVKQVIVQLNAGPDNSNWRPNTFGSRNSVLRV